MRQREWGKLWLWGGLLGSVPALFLEGLRLAMGVPFAWEGCVARWVGSAMMLVAASLTGPVPLTGARFRWPGLVWAVLVPGVGLIYGLLGYTAAAWVVAGGGMLLLLGLEPLLTATRSPLRRWFWRLALAASAGAFPLVLAQLESHFADEEFFVVLAAAALSGFWLLLLALTRFLAARVTLRLPWGGRLDRRWAAVFLTLAFFAGSNVVLWAYRHSFYPPVAPTYPGISAQTPFICGEVAPDPQVYAGPDVFVHLLDRVQANPTMESPEYGLLALGTGEQRWAAAFRETLLQEVAAGKYTGPAYSVKSGQFEAALRAYFFPRVHERFPGLFSAVEVTYIMDWFAAINRRALTVEPVDLMYALAFSKWPEGPYENQENGAGLLAVLEGGGLADPALSASNRDYLARNPRGWAQRFRVADDAIIYQPEWIDNALFQALYVGEAPDATNVRLSFEWLLLQARPDGGLVRYNHPGLGTLAGMAYLGAGFLDDPRYVWLAGQAVTELEQRNGYLFAQPGMEVPLAMEGHSPTAGSCLLFGDSGLPNQLGPLAPDKIVFRDGWSPDAAYLLLNLRFSGWHRYKGTGTVTLLYQAGVLAADVLDGQPFSWLPVGRAMFRDKRIPRENLNGLVVAKTGMAAVLYQLIGVGGPWAQDPPYYAEVLTFKTGTAVDWAHVRLSGWRGWQQDRWIYFYHDGGPIVVVDEARGPTDQKAALLWHFSAGVPTEVGRFRLREGDAAVEAVLLPQSIGGTLDASPAVGTSGLDVVYYGDTGLQMTTIFLPKGWVGAKVDWNAGSGDLEITAPAGVVGLTLALQR